jgi:peptidoglycan/LPS O-acetylase OafA/YrhL
MQKSLRFHELDSLRGLAALSVVFAHFHDVYFPEDRYYLLAPAQKVIVNLLSPFYRGGEAVFLFFALSGFVLSLPYTTGRNQPYGTFLVRRILRLYGPYFAALVLAVAGAACFHHEWGMGGLTDHTWTQPFNLGLVLQHVVFLGDYDYRQFNPAFWSLIIEMRVSILFPLLAILILRIPVKLSLVLATVCFIIERVVGHLHPSLSFTVRTVGAISSFILGILIATHLEKIRTFYEHLKRPTRIALAILMMLFYFVGHFLEARFHFNGLLQLIGSAGIMIIALMSARVQTVLHNPAALFLGRISYSLYLVHIPVLLTLTALLATRVDKPVIFVVYITSAILAGTIFNKLVEEPFIALSRRVGKRAKQPGAASPAITATEG